MAFRKNKRIVQEENKTTSEYYKLHTKEVADLIDADESNSPEVSKEELDKYRSGPKLRLSEQMRAVLIKMWFPGSVCFFIFWGLSTHITARLDLLVVFGMALGMVTDILTNNTLRFFAKTEGANDWCMMFPKRRYINFFLNIIYAMLLLACVDFLYNVINMLLITFTNGAYLGVEPILFAVFYTCFDLLFISIKRMFLRIIADARHSVELESAGGK